MFKFKGISSKEMDVYVTEIDNLIRKAPQRYEEIHIDGRDGAFFHPLGYSPIEVPLELTLMKPERIDEVLQWLNGAGWLEYNGRKTKAHIFSEVEPVRASTVKIIQVTIIRNPFWEKVEDDWEEAWGANLIKNGWDDFEPYPNNEPLGHYFPNYQEYESDEWYVGFVTDFKAEPNKEYVFQWDYEHLGGVVPHIDVGTATSKNQYHSDLISHTIKADKDFRRVFKLRDVDVENGRFYISFRLRMNQSFSKFRFGNIKIYEKERESPKVVKTPLGNGLTRIQTWGGNETLKLVNDHGGHYPPKINHTFKIYMHSINPMRFRLFNSNAHNVWLTEDESGQLIKYTGSNQKEVRRFTHVGTAYAGQNLNFIASDPIIVEGDRAPNWQATSDPAIYNEGTAVAKPLIKLEKGKDRQCEFEVNGTYFKFHFNDDDHVILDCEEMEATYNGFNRNRHLTIGFEWPKLKPKENFVKRISGDAKILFKRKDRWL